MHSNFNSNDPSMEDSQKQPDSAQNTKTSEGNWMNHPNLAGMDKSKLEMLQSLANQGSQKSQADLLPFLMAAAGQGKSNGLSFSSNEINTIIEVLKIGKSPQEAAKLDRIVSIMKMMGK